MQIKNLQTSLTRGIKFNIHIQQQSSTSKGKYILTLNISLSVTKII